MAQLEQSTSNLNIAAEPIVYSCTIMHSCEMDFDNYQEWCDHEMTAHPDEIAFYFCNEQCCRIDGQLEERPEGPCDQAFYTEKEFEDHYKAEHPDMPKIYSCEIGPTSNGLNFWCGFCCQAYPADYDENGNKVADWWEDRQSHIKGHFEGTNNSEGIHSIYMWYWVKGLRGSPESSE